MQEDEPVSGTGSVLSLGSVAKALNEVTQSKSDYSTTNHNSSITNSPSFYDGVEFPPLHVAMKRDPLSTVHPPGEGNKNYGQQGGYTHTNAVASRDAFCNGFYYCEGDTYNEGSPVLQRQDPIKSGKGVFPRDGHILEGNMQEQDKRYFGVQLPSFQVNTVSSSKGAKEFQPEKTGLSKDKRSENSQKHNSDGKPIRILQRPTLNSAVNAEKHSEDEAKMLDALTLLPQKRGHRKKTLSLNPEEREALEILVEEVIIGGFEEDIVSSDGSVSGDEDLSTVKSNDELKKPYKNPQDYIDTSIRYADQIKAEKETRLFNQRDFADAKKNHVQKDVSSKAGNRYGRRDQKKTKEGEQFGTKFSKSDHRTGECNSSFDKAASPSSDKAKLDAQVLGLNIYPAQLKVAIKHMDSLPPRFLRRLQSGQNRMDLILPRRLGMPSDERFEQAVMENDKGKSKETQLQETKKSIRNLLCDLDQYVDEGLTTPVAKESLTTLPFSISPCDLSKDGGAAFHLENFSGILKQTSPQDTNSLTYLNQPPFPSRLFPSPGGIPGLNLDNRDGLNPCVPPKLMVYHCEEVEKLLKSGSEMSALGAQTLYATCSEPKDMIHPNVEHFPGHIQPVDEYSVYNNQPTSVNTKKSQFSVDAPEFVSTLFKAGASVDAEAGYKPGMIGCGIGPLQNKLQLPVFASESGVLSGPLLNDSFPTVSAVESASRMKFIGMPGLPEPMLQYQALPFVPSSSLASSYLDPSTASQLPSELFIPPAPCPAGPPSSHPIVGLMHYHPYAIPPYVPGFSHPDFPHDKSNFLVPAVPDWGEVQVPSSVPVPAFGWNPPGQMPYVACSFGQQLAGKNPVIICNPDQVPVNPTWSGQNAPVDLDALYHRLVNLLGGADFVLIILVNGMALDLSALNSQLQMIVNETVLLKASAPAVGADTSDDVQNPAVVTAPNCGKNQMANLDDEPCADFEFKLKEAVQEGRRLIVVDGTFATLPWNFQDHIAMAQGQGYHVEVVDLGETGHQYAGSEMTAGSYMFDEDYQNPLIYPVAPLPAGPASHLPPAPQFINGSYSTAVPIARAMKHDVS